jgi:hypothetical protein
MKLILNSPAAAPEIFISFGGFRQAAVWSLTSFRLSSKNNKKLRNLATGSSFLFGFFLLAKQKKGTRL